MHLTMGFRKPLGVGPICAMALVAFAACDRFKSASPEQIAIRPLPFDSTRLTSDTLILQKQAAQDSLAAVREVQRRIDSILSMARPDAVGAMPLASETARSITPSAPSRPVPSRPMSSRPVLASPPGSGAPGRPSTPQISAAGTSPGVAQGAADGAALRASRVRALGDSIANAQINRMVGQRRTMVGGDTVRGLVKVDSGAVNSRPSLVVDKGNVTVNLSGMGIDGLAALAGSEVVVRGMRVGPRDVVVSGFTVRSVNGIAVLDGRLMKLDNGSWTLELSDNGGTRKLASVPAPLRAAAGSRIWIAAVQGGTGPQTYGVIGRR